MRDFEASKRAVLKTLEAEKVLRQETKRREVLKKKSLSNRTAAANQKPSTSASKGDGTQILEERKRRTSCLLFTHDKVVKARIGAFLGSLSNTTTFNKPEVALDWTMDHKPNLIFLDIDKPTPWTEAMDIFTNGSIALPDSKFIVITGDPRGSITRQMTKKNLYAILQKPVQPTTLRQILQGMLPEGCIPPKN